MTGKELKDFANRLPDDCLVEMNGVASTWEEKWQMLDPTRIRAVFTPQVETNVLKEE